MIPFDFVLYCHVLPFLISNFKQKSKHYFFCHSYIPLRKSWQGMPRHFTSTYFHLQICHFLSSSIQVKQMEMSEAQQLARNIVVFYNTDSETTRRHLQTLLETFRQEKTSWQLAIQLIEPTKPVNVQFYGAEVLYHNITKNFDGIVESMENTELLKNFLLQKLSTSAHSLPHSVLNKLSSALGLFILKTMPDIWPSPLKDLTMFWAGQTELLLRIFAEIPAEFQKLNESLDHRNRVKTQLQNATTEIVQMVRQVLEDPDSQGSVRNAAVECVEGWLKLPGANLLDFLPTFDAVFRSTGNDFFALARIIDTLKANDELRNLPRLVWQLVQVIGLSICPLLQAELATILGEPSAEESTADRMEELQPLLCTIVEFAHDFAKNIVDQTVKSARDEGIRNVYITMCHFFVQVSNLPGLYPARECLSHLAEPWWYALREELLQPDQGSDCWSEGKRLLRAEAAQWFVQMLEAAIPKLAVGPAAESLDREQRERFEAYRMARSDLAANAIQMAPEQTMALLAGQLNAALDAYEPGRSEAVIYLISEAADFLTESQLCQQLVPVLPKCGTVEEWACRVPAAGLIRFARSFLQLISRIEHLLLPCAQAQPVLPSVVHILLSYLQVPDLGQQTLDTLILLMKKREQAMASSVDPIIHCCYAFFLDANQQPEECRLLAIRCVGLGLSFKDAATIIESLNNILAPRLAQLDSMADQVANGNLNTPAMDAINFELSALAQLVATLQSSGAAGGDSSAGTTTATAEATADQSGPVKSILQRALPLFNKLFSQQQQKPTGQLVARVAEVLIAGIQSLYTDIASFLGLYLNFLDAIFEHNPEPACELAKKLFLTFHRGTPTETPLLLCHLARWFSARSPAASNSNSATTTFPTGLDEKLVELAYHVVKKFWPSILYGARLSADGTINAVQFVQHLCLLIVGVVERSRDISLVQEALRTLNLLLKNLAETDHPPTMVSSLEPVAERVIGVLFRAIQSEANSSNVNLIADIFLLLERKYPAQTRSVVHRLPGGNSQLVGAMFAQSSTRNFRLRVLQMHQAALRGGAT